MSWIDALGLLAGILVSVSLLMRSVERLRMINLMGCLLFVAWGLLVCAVGVWLCNGVGVLVNIYRIYELRKGGKG